MPDDFRKTLREKALAGLEPVPEEERSFSTPVPVAPGINIPIPREVTDIVNPAVEAALGAVEDTFFQIGKGMDQITREDSNILAGATNLAGGLLKVPMLMGIAPFSAIDAGLRASGKTGEDIADVVNVPFEFLHTLPKELAEGESVFSVGRAVESSGLGDFVRDNIAFRIDPETAEESKEAINNVAGLLTTISALKGIHKAKIAAKSKIGDILKKRIKIDESTVQNVPETQPLRLEQTTTRRGERVFEADTRGNIKQVLTDKQKVDLGKLKTEKSTIDNKQVKLTEEIKTLKETNKGERKLLKTAKDKKTVGKRIKANNELIKEKRNEFVELDKRLPNVTKKIDQFEKALKFETQKQLPKETKTKSGVSETKNVPSKVDFSVPKDPKGQIKGTPVLVLNQKTGKFKLAKKDKQTAGLTEEKVLPVKTDDYVAVQTNKGVRFKDPETGKIISKEKAVAEATKQAEKPQTKPITFESAKTEIDQIIETVKKQDKNVSHDIGNKPNEVLAKILKQEKGDPESTLFKQANKHIIDQVAKERELLKAEKVKAETPKIEKKIEPQKVETKVPTTFIKPEKIETAKKNIIDKSGNLNAGFDPTLVKDYATIGAGHLETVVRSGVKKAQQFKEWSKPMLEEFGQKIRPHLLKIWARIKREFGKKLIEFSEKNPFVKSSFQTVEGGFSDALKGSKIPQKEFVKNRENLAKQDKLTSRAKESIDKEIQSIKKGVAKRAKPLDTRLFEINPKIYQAVKKNDFNTNIRTIVDETKISKLTEPAKKLPKGVHKDIDLVLKNNERGVARKIFKEHGLEKQFDNTIKTIEKISDELGVEKNIPGWFPRMVRDYEGLMKEFYKKLGAKLKSGEVKKVRNFLEQLKIDKQKKLGRDLSIEEEATLYNNALRGYNPGIKLSKIANEKARVIEVLDADLNKYYHRWDAAVTAYVGQAREAISARTLFGKKKGQEVDFTEKSVGRLIAEQMLDEPLSPKQIFEVKEILKSAFQPRKAEAWVSTIKDVGYLTRLFNWVSSLTQLGDNYVPLYRSPRQFVKSFPKAVGGQIPGIKKWVKSDIPLRKLGIDVDRFARELVDPKQRGKVMKSASVASLFKSIDIVGKETLVNTLYQKYHKAAVKGRLVKGHPDYWRFERRFGKNADAVIKEFATRKPGDLTGRMAFQLFDELDATQPYSRWATPESFHTTGALGQLAYQFKTFTLRRIDFVLNETLRRVRDPKTSKKERIRAGKNLVKLLTVITLVDGSVDVAKKLLRGQKIELSDIAIDNLLGLFMLSKYDVTTAKREGLGSAIASKIAPVTGAVDDIYMDMIGIFGDKDFKFRTIRNLPVFGEVVYNWLNNSTKRTTNRSTNRSTKR